TTGTKRVGHNVGVGKRTRYRQQVNVYSHRLGRKAI
ncbi:putative fimbrial assembly protein PilO, partial [Vibrio parahaemolyticus VP2007-007]